MYSLYSVYTCTCIEYVELNRLVTLRHSRASGLAKRMAVNMKTVILMMRPTVVKITHAATWHSVRLLRQYSVQQGVSDANNTALDMCTEEIFSKAASEKRQTTLDSFML